MAEPGCQIGMVGLGTMGRNLVLNMASHGFTVAGFDVNPGQAGLMRSASPDGNVQVAADLREFAGLLRSPRAIMLLVPAGRPVDAVIESLLPVLAPDDLIIDGGNSHFLDTDRRATSAAQRGILYLGTGISGGEQGARLGPSLMPGGSRPGYERVRPIFEAVAARADDGQPCAAYLGPGSAGHYVKMVHNGIEYGLMQAIAESYDLMKRGLSAGDDELHAIYDRWNQGELNSFLIEITARIFCQEDRQTGKRLVDEILDEAGQKGTGMWTSQDAMGLQVPVPSIDAAVSMRDLSGLKTEREEASGVLRRPVRPLPMAKDAFVRRLERALYAAMLITYAQGMALLARASQAYHYDLNLETVATIWRGGCIIRSAMLENLRAAFRTRAELANLLLDPSLAAELVAREEDLRLVVQSAAASGIPAPALAMCLSYLDGYRSAWLPANLIQAQRDLFGAHTYERTDAQGVFHTQWEDSCG